MSKELTSEEKARLAKACGAKLNDCLYQIHKGNSRFWEFPGSNRLVNITDWQPDTNGTHTLMVLDAWADKDGWFYVLRLLASQAFDNKKFNFGSAVCAAGLEVLKKEVKP